MKLLVVTQTVDIHNTTLGFFTRWIEELAIRFDSIEVICLYEGTHHLPNRVFSLGKEKGNSRFQYIVLFFQYIFTYRKDYDAVFVHMNQEYIVLGGWLWKLLGKKIYFWRNHPYGNMWTRIAVFFSDKVFCTADKSFTAHYKKTMLMPAGVDTSLFLQNTNVLHQRKSLLVFGRISPVKQIEKAIDATARLLAQGISVELSIVGDYLSRDVEYVECLKKRVTEAHIGPSVHFIKGVDFLSAPQIYQQHEIFLNFTESGSFDKTVIEALACGTKVLVSNTSMKNILPAGSYTTGESDDVLEKIEKLLNFTSEDEKRYNSDAQKVVYSQSLTLLMDTLKNTFIHV